MTYEIALIQALGIALGGMFSPGSILIMLILLSSKKAPRSAMAYLAGYMSGYVIIGATYVYVRGLTPPSIESNGISWPYIALALFLYSMALRTFFKKPEKTKKNSLLKKVDAMPAFKIFGLGCLVTLINVKNLGIFLSAVSALAVNNNSVLQSYGSILLVVVVFCSALYIPLLIYFLLPSQSAVFLAKIKFILEWHGRKILLIAIPTFATFFLLKGLMNF